MKSYIKVGLMSAMLVSISACSTGCASYMVYNKSQEKVAMRKALARGDDRAIKAVQIGDGAGVGIDVSNWEALSEQPLLQLGAALLDAAMVYGGYKGIESINNDNDKDKQKSDVNTTTVGIDGNGNTTTVIVGSGNNTTATPNYDSGNTTTSTSAP